MKNFLFALALLAVTSTLSIDGTASNVYSTYKEAWRNCTGGVVNPRYEGSQFSGYVCVESLDTHLN